MDILRFINSKSIAQHFKDVKYEFNALEAAFLVWQSKFTSIAEKCEAWQSIIAKMPDMLVKKRRYGWKTDESLHEFLRKYVELVRTSIDGFYKVHDEIYSYSVLFRGDTRWTDEDNVYASFEQCNNAIDEDKEDCDIAYYTVHKRKPGGGKTISLTFDANGNAIDFFEFGDPHAISKLWEYFDGLWLELPTPFKRGDIVYLVSRETKAGAEKINPFVLTNMSTWGESKQRENGCIDEERIAEAERLVRLHRESGDTSDMWAYGYFTSSNGKMYTDHALGSYLDLEYCEGELEKSKRILIALSNYEKGEIGLELLLNAYLTLYNENDTDEVKRFLAFDDKALKLAGLK